MAALRRALLRLVSFFRADRAETDLAREIDAHLRLLEDTFVARGLSAGEARSAARRAFGGVEQIKEHQRDARGLRALDNWWLDTKLGARMLIKYPGLSLVGCLGIAVAIACGTAAAVFDAVVHSPLPLDEGERVVAIENWDVEVNNQERRILHDFAAWRDELTSVEELGAFRQIQRNLILEHRPAEPVSLAEITASGFRLPRVPPLMGRHLVADDERAGAPAVAVIGYDLWQTRFAAAPGVIGRTLQLGNVTHTIVGVMPEGFAFPLNDRLWVPLRANPSDYERRRGPGIFVFGRLAPGADLARAQAELTAIGIRTAALSPKTHDRLRPRVVPYTLQVFDDMEGWEIPASYVLSALLVGVVSVNVGILVYARTATRRREIAVRTALGASRRRIIGQLFVEALVLSALAAVIGLLVASAGLRQVEVLIDQVGGLPFWMTISVSSATVVYSVMALTVLGAVIVGVIPALQATGRRAQSGLQHFAASASGLRLGRMWTTLIVVQVAVAVAFLPVAVGVGWAALSYGTATPGFAAGQFLTARMVMERQVPPTAQAEAYARATNARFADRQAELMRRLAAEPGVARVIPLMSLPGVENEARIEVASAPDPAGHVVGVGRVEAGFFDAFDVPILMGRRFNSGAIDTVSASRQVIVNRSFVERVLGGRHALGHRIRYLEGGPHADDAERARWYEIVGIASDFPTRAMTAGYAEAKIYHALEPGQAPAARIALRIRGEAPAAFAGRLREITTALDPALQLHDVRPLNDVLRDSQAPTRIAASAIGLGALSVLLLSAAGIYALMSVTITQRRREIGIRVALGADRRRILGSIFSRALGQLGLGVIAGLAVAAALDVASLATDGELVGGGGRIAILAGVGLFMMAVGVLAAIGPARRGLRVPATEALREE
jgi:putative ABC transport system permease protein